MLLDCAYDINWGDVPTWIAAIGAILALFVGSVALWQTWKTQQLMVKQVAVENDAWVFVKKGDLRDLGDLGGQVILEFYNSGNVPSTVTYECVAGSATREALLRARNPEPPITIYPKTSRFRVVEVPNEEIIALQQKDSSREYYVIVRLRYTTLNRDREYLFVGHVSRELGYIFVADSDEYFDV